MTEEKQGGTAPEPEASASLADRAQDEAVGAVAVADEPASQTEAVAPTAADADGTEPATLRQGFFADWQRVVG